MKFWARCFSCCRLKICAVHPVYVGTGKRLQRQERYRSRARRLFALPSMRVGLYSPNGSIARLTYQSTKLSYLRDPTMWPWDIYNLHPLKDGRCALFCSRRVNRQLKTTLYLWSPDLGTIRTLGGECEEPRDIEFASNETHLFSMETNWRQFKTSFDIWSLDKMEKVMRIESGRHLLELCRVIRQLHLCRFRGWRDSSILSCRHHCRNPDRAHWTCELHASLEESFVFWRRRWHHSYLGDIWTQESCNSGNLWHNYSNVCGGRRSATIVLVQSGTW